MRFRSAIIDDIPALVEIERLAPTAAHWSVEQYQQAFLVAEPPRITVVAEEDEGVAGFLMGRGAGKEWEIENIVVTSGARQRGLGTQLLREFLALARGRQADAIWLEVRESNQAARRLYEKCAFTASGQRKAYYHDPVEDAVAYRLDFSKPHHPKPHHP